MWRRIARLIPAPTLLILTFKTNIRNVIIIRFSFFEMVRYNYVPTTDRTKVAKCGLKRKLNAFLWRLHISDLNRYNTCRYETYLNLLYNLAFLFEAMQLFYIGSVNIIIFISKLLTFKWNTKNSHIILYLTLYRQSLFILINVKLVCGEGIYSAPRAWK